LEVITRVADLRNRLDKESSVGFVPTMGALHNGHKALIDRARAENRVVVVSIFVNPTQFLEGEDFSKYPRTFDKDREVCRLSGVDYIFLPDVDEVYFSDELSILAPKERGFTLEGFHRIGHFNGMLQIVLKLLNIVQPQNAYFGKKDAQQLALIQQMVKELFLRVNIVPVDIIRDRDGLALSSRNRYLSHSERDRALAIPKSLEIGSKLIMSGERSTSVIINRMLNALQELDIDYVEIVRRDFQNIESVEIGNSIILVAVRVGNTRLIDNMFV
jgi:pantoate--beta-alanine ligase